MSIAGIVVAHKRGHFALDCWQLRDVCRETRYIAGVMQPGTVADLIFHGCQLGGVSKLLEEARKCKRKDYRDIKGVTQLTRAAWDNDVERVQQLLGLGCPMPSSTLRVRTAALHYCWRVPVATRPSCASCWRTARTSISRAYILAGRH